jgi:HAD superfamily hydrolase (TIGR01509 family)
MFTIFWDTDGVLVDTEGLYYQACREMLDSVDIELTLDQFKEISLRRGESTFLLAADKGVSADRVTHLRQQRDRRYAELLETGSCVIDGAEDVLRTLQGQVRMGIVTGAQRKHFETIHARSGLTRYVDFVLTREDYVKPKPHPDPYLTALQRNDLKPDRCIVVEDSERGLASATAAGVECIIVLSEWTRDGDFEGAVAVVDTIAGVPELVRKRMAAAK